MTLIRTMLRTNRLVFVLLCMLFTRTVPAQDNDKFLHSREGNTLGYKKDFVLDCVAGYGAPLDNPVLRQVCSCQVNLIDWHFSNSQIRDYRKKYKRAGFSRLIGDDTLLQNQISQCAAGVNDLLLLSIPSYRKNFITRCKDMVALAGGNKKYNDTAATVFCNCAVDVLEQRKITIEKFEDLEDPSSFLYNEVVYRCGSPWLEATDFAHDWQPDNRADIEGPYETDSVPVLSVMGMHKIKMTIGSETRIWLLDSGASDLLVSEEFFKKLKDQGVVTNLDYIGEGRYAMADSRVIACKRYKIDGVHIGEFTINNVVIAASRYAKEFLVGKSLLNKFRHWTLDNENNVLVLTR